MKAIVTGGSSRTGLEIVKYLLGANYTVYTNYYSSSKKLDSLLLVYPQKLKYIKCDLSNKKERDTFITHYKKDEVYIDVLINTFGDYIERDILALDSNDLHYMLNSNLIYVDDLIKSSLDLFNKNSSIINFGYSHGDKIVADIDTTYYHIAKMGLLLLTKAYAKKLGNRNINVNMISPGVLENSIVIPDNIENTIPMNRLCSLSEVVECVVFLIKNRYVTGNNVILSGGYNI